MNSKERFPERIGWQDHVVIEEGYMQQPSPPLSLVYIYAHQDAALRSQLEWHLEGLRQQGLISTWSDRQIVPGTDWQHTISTQIQQASIILLLMSADFMASDYCFEEEMHQALERQAAGEALVIPVLVRPVEWHSAPFAHLQALPRNGKAVSLWTKRDDAWTEIALGIKEAIDHLHRRTKRASCFIAYSHQDEAFAERLYHDLQAHEVLCWYAPVDLAIGSKIRQSIEDALQQHDKLLLILSEAALKSAWMEQEVEAVFERETRDKPLVLFPIRLDEAVMQTRQAWAASIRRMRHIGDFRQWQEEKGYQRALQRLLRDLSA